MTQLVATANTYPGSRDAWLRARFQSLVRAFERDDAPTWLAWRLAWVVLVLWKQESGDGRGERNFNSGNIHGSGSVDAGDGWHGDVYGGTDSAELHGTQVPVRFRAYATPEDAAADTIQLLSGGGYRASWIALVDALAVEHVTAADAETAARRWYDAMTRAGYHPWVQASTDEYVRLWRRGAPED